MDTTVKLDDDVAGYLEEQARILDKPFGDVLNDTLRRGMPNGAATPDAPGDSTARRRPFRVVPLVSGLAPGIDPLRLNELNAELEDAEILKR